MAKRKPHRSSNRHPGGGAPHKPRRNKANGAAWRSFLLGVALFISFFWAVLFLSVFLSVGLIAIDAENYRPARFTVDEVVYSKQRKRPTEFFAIGRIDGVTPESFNLHGIAPELRTREQLESHFNQRPVVFDVMYNPTRTEWRVNGDSIRVQPAQPNFVAKFRNSALYGLVNIVLASAVVLFCIYWLRRLNPKRATLRPPAPGTERR